ncbi:ATP-binding protein [Pararhizobium qamdonense]|uniref:ATP-binding protein n=1 Tax=Pararhizobium qamdonense TaxID=3031126 RepID=UPI0023E24EAB|nr:ATP-binding protein [Pararhizobium qamdonense]
MTTNVALRLESHGPREGAPREHRDAGSIEISTTFPLFLPPVLSDPNQLESALLNLVVNARDAMPDGGMISISARKHMLKEKQDPDLAAGEYVCLSVKDEGAGMDAATLEKATTPFFTTKGIGKGTGLGLPMVQGLMAQSGGRLIMKSKSGQGTTAELWLPVVDISAVPEPVAEIPSSAPVSPMTVMAVDDDSLVLMNTVLMLEDLGHTVIEASSGEDALRRLELGPLPDILITDHAMPQMTGAELARQVAEKHPELNVILATGYAELPGGEGAGLARLSKPFTQDQLNNALAAAAVSR